MSNVYKAVGRPDEPSDVITNSLRPQRRFAVGSYIGGSKGGKNDVQQPVSIGSRPTVPTAAKTTTSTGSSSTTTTDKTVPEALQSLLNGMSDADKKKYTTLFQGFDGKSNTEKQSILTQVASSGYNVASAAKAYNLDSNSMMADPVTPVANVEELQKYVGGAVKDVTKEADFYKEQLLAQGLPDESALTKRYYEGVAALPNVGTPTVNEAVGMTRDVYDKYGDAGSYNKTDYSGIQDAYRASMGYDKTNYGDLDAAAAAAGGYNKTGYGDIEAKYGAAGEYDPADITTGDYTASEIQKRMNPYEELVANRVRDRMREEYQQGRGERETAAARAGAFGGSAAAVQEMLARKQYEDRLKDYNAESASGAFASGTDLYSKYMDMLRGEQLSEEESRQFGANMGMQGLEGQLTARQQAALEEAKAKEAELSALKQQTDIRGMTAQETAQAKQAEQAGIAGLLDATDKSAMETARAKEAEFKALEGQGNSAQLMGQQGAVQKELGVTDLQGMQSAGSQQFNYELGKQEYPMEVLQNAQNIYATGVSGTPLAPTPAKVKTPDAPWYQQAAGVASAVAGAATAAKDLGFFRDGGIVSLHRAMFQGKE